MVTIRLLPKPRRAWLTSFGVVVSTMILAGFAVAAFQRQSLTLLGAGAGVTLMLVSSSRLWPWVWNIPYRAWNKLGRHYGDVARFSLLGLCYLIVSAVGVAGSSKEFVRTARSGSGWIRREKSNSSWSIHQGRLRHSWMSGFLSWASESRQYWALALLPFLILLSTLEIAEESQAPSRTYTLF